MSPTLDSVDTSGRDLRKLREEAGLTQAQLGERLGIDQRSVWTWEHQETLSPRQVARATAALKTEDELPERLTEMSTPRLLAEIVNIVAVLTERSANITPTGEIPSDPRPVPDPTPSLDLGSVDAPRERQQGMRLPRRRRPPAADFHTPE